MTKRATAIETLRQSEFCTVLRLDNGGIRYGIKQMAFKDTTDPAKMEAAIAATSIVDDDDFDDAVSALFKN